MIVSLPLYLVSRCHFVSRFLANNGNGRLSLDGYSCTSRVLSNICRDGEMQQRTVEWVRERACYDKSRLTGCGTPAEEMPQSKETHWRAYCAAAELYIILCKVQPSSLRNCSTCLCKVQTHIYIYTVLVTRNFKKSADCPCRQSAVFPRHCRGYLPNYQRASAESWKGVRGIVKGCPRNRKRVPAESWKGVCRFVEGHEYSHNRLRYS